MCIVAARWLIAICPFFDIIDKCTQYTHSFARSFAVSHTHAAKIVFWSVERSHTKVPVTRQWNLWTTYFRNWHGYANSGIFFMISASLKLSGKLCVMTPDTFSPTAVGAISHQYSNSFLTSSLREGDKQKKTNKSAQSRKRQINRALRFTLMRAKTTKSRQKLMRRDWANRENIFFSANTINNWLCDGDDDDGLRE